MANTIKGAVLMYDASNFSNNTTLKKVALLKEQMVTVAHGWVVPFNDNGLGATTYGGGFLEQIAQPTNGKRATQVMVAAQNNVIHTWAFSCNSQDFDTACLSTNPQNFTDLAVASGSGYNTVG